MNRQGAEAAEGRLKYLACMADLAVKYGAGESRGMNRQDAEAAEGEIKILGVHGD